MRKKRKPKVYIPTYKIIILCASVIAVCMTLLLITTIASGNKADKKRNKADDVAATKIENNSPFFSENTDVKNDNDKTEKKSLSAQEIKSDKKNDLAPAQKNNNTAKTSDSNTKKETVSKSLETKPAENTTKNVNEVSKNVGEIPKPVETKKTTEKPEPAVTKSTSETKKSEQKASGFNFPQAVNSAQLVFVFDDGGQNLEHLKKFLALPFPITVAVLPQITHSRESAEMVRKSGNELILHQPMQALNAKVNPGPGAITPQMTEDEIMSVLFQNINELGQIAGMNNHEGSAITADAEKMSVVLKAASENGIYFLDSRTNSESKVPYVASELGYSYYERNIFLDNTKKRADILAELNKGLGIANKNGVAIMIGHVWSADVLPDLLNEIYPELKQKGYTFTTVSNSRGKK